MDFSGNLKKEIVETDLFNIGNVFLPDCDGIQFITNIKKLPND